MLAPPTVTDIATWAQEIDTIGLRLAGRFARSEPRRRVVNYLRGLLSHAPRKNGWQLAEEAGDETPHGVQHLLGRADWDADEVRDDLRAYLSDHLLDPRGIFILDETGFLKKGTKSAGVGRQYSGTAGRIENCQIGVFLAFTGRNGHALLDRELYLPQQWAGDTARRQAAHIPPEVTFATKPQLAERMLQRAWKAGLKAAWVTGDAVYGNDAHLRRMLQAQRQPFVLAVKCDTRVFDGQSRDRVDAIAEALPARAWRKISAGAGSKGPRWFDWARVELGVVDEQGWRLWLLVRRQRTAKRERAYYLCRGPAQTPRSELVRVAGARWAVEECFERAKGDCGLDGYEVRSWVGWYRHITLSMFALAMLSVIRWRVNGDESPKKGGLD